MTNDLEILALRKQVLVARGRLQRLRIARDAHALVGGPGRVARLVVLAGAVLAFVKLRAWRRFF